jgi:hypothetical protein
LKKVIKSKSVNGKIVISFPESKAGQVVISAIAIASVKKNITKGAALNKAIYNLSYANSREMHWMDIGNSQYADVAVTINSLPSNLFGASWFQFYKKSKQEFVAFNTLNDIELFVAIERNWSLPNWLETFENTAASIITDENKGTIYKVLRKRILKGERVTFPFDNTMLVAYQPANNMQPAYDLKSTTQYRTNAVKLNENVAKDSANGRLCAVVNTNNKATVDYAVQTGVPDRYSLTVKYYSGKEQSITGKLQLLDAGKTMMQEEAVNFIFTRSGKWNQFTINTSGMINAGNYTVRLVIENAKDLAISSIDVQ